MQSRRNEDFERTRHVGQDSYLMMPPRLKRSLSPRRMEGGPSHSQRVLGGHRRSSSLERRRVEDDYGRRIRSRSPPFMEAKRGKHLYDDGCVIDRDLPPLELRRRYEFFDCVDMNRGDVDSRMGDEFGYKHRTSRAIIEEKFEDRRFDGGMRGMMGQKSAVTGDGSGRGVYRSAADMGPNSRYDEHGVNISAASGNMGLDHPKNERVRYPEVPDSFPADKYTAMEQYVDGRKNMLHVRDAPYSNVTTSRSKESIGASHLKDYASVPPGSPRVDYLGYRGGMPLPPDDRPRSSANMQEPLSHSRYGERQYLDLGRDHDLEINEDLARHRREMFSPPRTGHRDSLRHQARIRESDDFIFPSDENYGKMNLRERADYSRTDLIRPSMMDPTAERETTEFAHGTLRNSSLWDRDHHSIEKLTASNNIGLNRLPAEKRESRRYLESATVHSRLGRQISSEHESPYLEMARDREIRHMRVDHDFKQGPGPHKERMRGSPGFPYDTYDTERPRLAERTHGMEMDELAPYDSSSRITKRKYIMDEEANRIPSRPTMNRLDAESGRHDRYDRGDEWIGKDGEDSVFTKRGGYAHGFNRRADKPYDDIDAASEDWLLSHDPEELMRGNPTRSYRYGSKFAKGYSRPGAPGWYNSYPPDRRHVNPKWKNVWVRGRDDDVDMHPGEAEDYENWANFTNSEPPEDSDKFKQLVHDLFLSFTKKLNETQGVRRRYLEQGRAGSLFCIVCGRSVSKEFLDTQRLATHAFMSHKVGLRAQHLALHKAICVLLGWNSTILPDTITWSPETLSSSEALAQKEDLIIWPPLIIIHNTSLSNSDSDGQDPTSAEALGLFLRGKGFSGGKVKLGKPANSSIMLVKFLGTFSGLQDAEKIHHYFANNKRGRKEFEQIASGKGKNSISSAEGEKTKGGDKVNELVLFGYVGIAEDLDKVDFDTKRKCTIKSKKDIQDLVDAPVKPE